MYISIVKNTRQVPHNACVIFCLTRGYPKFQKFRYTKLILRNLHIKKAMKKYPLMLDNIIFHEGNISLFDRIFIKIFSFNWKINFLKIDNFYEDTSFLGEFPSDAPLGYIMMCRFQYGKVWNILKRYDTLIRIDDDCFIYKIPTLEKNQFFACSGISSETHLDTNYSFPKFLQTLGRLSPEARNLITIENDEMTNGLDTTLAVAQHVALVLDVHHHWINTGEYIEPQDVRTSRVIDSWRGVRPAMHFSTSREDVLVDHVRPVRPDLAELLARGYKKQKLRAHSDFCWNRAVNEWVLGFSDQFDIQVEAKGKNLASEQLYEQYTSQHL